MAEVAPGFLCIQLWMKFAGRTRGCPQSGVDLGSPEQSGRKGPTGRPDLPEIAAPWRIPIHGKQTAHTLHFRIYPLSRLLVSWGFCFVICLFWRFEIQEF